MNRRKIEKFIGRALYTVIGKHMPLSGARISSVPGNSASSAPI